MNIGLITRCIQRNSKEFDIEFKKHTVQQQTSREEAQITTLDRKKTIEQGKNKIKNKWQ